MAAAGGAAAPPPVQALADSLRHTYGDSVLAVLYYGSCLRGGDPFDGLVDLYVLVDSYRGAYGPGAKALWNRLLPPNVFYREQAVEGGVVRSKYAVLSMADFRRGTSKRWFHSYLWGRFSQPTGLVWVRDADTRTQVERTLAQAVVTFLGRVVPRVEEPFDAISLWRQGLALSYRSELRAERPGRNETLVEMNRAYYQAITGPALARLPWPVQVEGSGEERVFRVEVPQISRRMAGLGWLLRRWQGKVWSVLRLLKALFTFEGGLDYIVWKLERHSGRPIEVPERVRRRPLIFVWGLFWRLYREGYFR